MSNLAAAIYFRVLKSVDTLAYVGLIVLTWRFLAGDLHWKLAIGATIVSGAWLAVTLIRISHLLKTYFDVLSRLELAVPLILGGLLAALALVGAGHAAVRGVAVAELVGWVVAYLLYRRNRSRYVRQGHGPLPADCWISPPSSALQAGDLVLTSGQVAKRLRESVGHGEVVIEMPDGSKNSFSSYMGTGAVLHPLDTYAAEVRLHGHYIALRPRRPLTDEQIRRAPEIVAEMLRDNDAWRERVNRRRKKLVGWLPLPRRIKDRLAQAVHASGYDWFGLFMGRLAPHRWTCIGACLEVYRRLGVPTGRYGTGLLGFGTTLFDPIMPVRFLSDPDLQLLQTARQEAGSNQ